MYEYSVSLSPVESICTWNAYDYYCDSEILFYDCVLKMDIAPFKKGDLIPSISYDYEKFVINFFVGDKLYQYPVTLFFQLEAPTIRDLDTTYADELRQAEKEFYEYGKFFHENG